MKFINSIIADWKYGKASSKIRKGQYKDAIEILTNVLKIDNNDSDSAANALIMYDLGYCYFKCNENEIALSFISKAYNMFKQEQNNLKTEVFCNLLSLFSYLLIKKGDQKLAEKVSEEEKQLRKELAKERDYGVKN